MKDVICREFTTAERTRFWSKVDTSDGLGPNGTCWEWRGGGRGMGYGAFKIDGKVWDTHRAAFLIHHGYILTDQLVMHSCDNKRCVNPAHLSLGTYTDNRRDALARSKSINRSVRTNPLTADEIATLRDEYASGVSMRVLVKKYQIAQTTMRRVLGIESPAA